MRKKYIVVACWRPQGQENKFCVYSSKKIGAVTTRPDLRENMNFRAPIFVMEYCDVCK